MIHSGGADSGHYYSFIQERGTSVQKWYEFDDTYVRPFHENDISTEAFGGEELIANGHKEMKSRNAYMLFYERETMLETQQLQFEVQRRTSVSGKGDIQK